MRNALSDRVEAGDALEVGLGELARGELPRRDQLGLAREAGEDGVGGHGGGGYRAWDDRPLPVTDRRHHRRGPRPLRGPRRLHGRRAARRGVAARPAARGRSRGVGGDALGAAAVGAVARAARDGSAIVASVLALTAPLPAAIVAAVAAVSLALEAGGRSGPLRWILPRRATQNVLTVPDEEGAAEVTLLICARYDAPRGGLATRDGPRRLAARLRRRIGGRAPGPRTWVALALLAVAVCAGLRALGLEGLWLGLRAVRADGRAARRAGGGGRRRRLPVSPRSGRQRGGRRCRAGAARRADPQPARRARPRAAALRRRRRRGCPPCARTCGASGWTARAWSCSSSARAAPAVPPTPRRTRSCAPPASALAAARAPLRGASAAAAARGRRLPAAWIGALDAAGIAPRSRQSTDTLEHLDPAAADAVLDFALACVAALDAELST